MFTSQSNQLNTALQQSGIPPNAADAIVQSIANCAATLQHRGPVSFEYVPQTSRLVTPAVLKYSTQPLGNFEISDGERRPYRPPDGGPPDAPDETDDPERPAPDSPPEPFDPTALWAAINRLRAEVRTVAAQVRINRAQIVANHNAILYILRLLQNTTDCEDDHSAPTLIPEGALGPGIGGLG